MAVWPNLYDQDSNDLPMNNAPLLVRLAFGLLLALCMSGCDSAARWDRESLRLEQCSLDLDRQYQQLNFAIDSLWDTTTDRLAKAMPADIPPVDRKIFLTSRNANHIRMFDSFQSFPDSTRTMVDLAAIEDEKLAAKFMLLAKQKAQFEKEKIAFLAEVAHHHPEQYKTYALRLNGQYHDHEF